MFDAGGVGGGGDGCSEESKLVYVVSQENTLHSFDPGSLTFTSIGALDCPGSGQPFSMAVARNGVAWVLYTTGRMYNVDIHTAHCTPTMYTPGQHGFQTFGMGFASDTAGGTTEKLYLANYSGTGLATLDTTTLQVTPVGMYDALHQAAELTGNGDAQLFGFFTGNVVVAEIDKSDAHIISQAPQPTVNIGSAWAFAFWGGSFWLFTHPSGKPASIVQKYDPAAGTTTVVVPNVGGFSIVGAGVSTCAPVQPPS
jgi:hypothetical protein